MPGLTSLRFFAAFLVVLFHLQSMQITLGPVWFRELSSIGYVGVSFFFVLSGFILVYTCQGKSVNVMKFWRTRFARIYPAYVFSLLLMAPWFFYAATKLKFPLFAWATGHLKSASLLVMTLTQAWVPGNALAWNSVCWSLSVESFFYLLFPLLLLVFARRSRGRLLFYIATSWTVGLAISVIYLWLKPDGLSTTNSEVINAFWLNALQFNPMARLPEFMMGMACGFLFLRSKKNDKLAVSLIATGVAGFILVVRCGNWIPFPVLHTALLAPAFAAIVYGVALRPRYSQFLENKTLVLLGDASYSLYLLHTLAIGAVFQFSKTGFENPTILKTVTAVTVAILVSVAVYRWIEVPGLRMLRPKDKRKPEIAPQPVFVPAQVPVQVQVQLQLEA
ncbi:MAG TPA: acyltransferase [Candidatus Acidoferrales bacterium]